MSSENQSDASVSWDNLVRFVRQLSHDLRNDLNAAELQAAYIGELTTENAELKEEVKRLREMILKLAVALQGLSAVLAPVSANMMPYGVSDFMEDLRQKIAQDLSAESATVNWKVEAGDATFDVDPQLLQQAFLELLRNAFQHERGEGRISVMAKIDNGKLVVTLHEPKARFEMPTDNWGRAPLAKVRQGHYGLGLNRARVILEAHGGTLRAKYDPTATELITTVTLPISSTKK